MSFSSGNQAIIPQVILYKDIDFKIQNDQIVIGREFKLLNGNNALFLTIKEGMKLWPVVDELGRRSMVLEVTTQKAVPNTLFALLGFVFNGDPDYPNVWSISTFDWKFKIDGTVVVDDNYATALADPLVFSRAILVTASCWLS